MPRGDKSKYTDKQERKADHIAEGYEKRGMSEGDAERRAWATVNKESGGNKSGSGRGKKDTHESSQKGGRIDLRSPIRLRGAKDGLKNYGDDRTRRLTATTPPD
jgi:plasmid stabilization system protein ParE